MPNRSTKRFGAHLSEAPLTVPLGMSKWLIVTKTLVFYTNSLFNIIEWFIAMGQVKNHNAEPFKDGRILVE